MMRRTGVVACAFLLVPPALAAIELNEVLSRLEERQRTLSSVQFDFSQSFDFAQWENKTTVKGEATFGKNGRARITKREPEEQITVSNGDRIWIYTPAHKQAWRAPAKSWTDSELFPKGLLPVGSYLDDLRERFRLSLLKSDAADNAVVLRALPKEDDQDYDLEITISTENWLPMKTVYRSDSARVETTLSNVKINPALAKGVFDFRPPAGVDVIPFN